MTGQSASGEVILASDRGPVTFVRSGAGLQARRRPGSVTAILDAAARSMTGTATSWIALTTAADDRIAIESGAFARPGVVTGYKFEPIFIDETEYRDYYAEAGARMLWIAHHGLWQEIGELRCQPPAVPPRLSAFTGAYQRVNQRLAEKIAAAARADTLILLHDYQLATAPGFLRRECPRQPVAHFTHTPFADPGALARLPGEVGRELLAGMLGADLLGFQCQQWADNFLACCEQSGYRVNRREYCIDGPSRRTFARSYPAPTDAAVLARESSTAGVLAWERRLGAGPVKNRANDRVKNIVRIERLDPAKNVLRGVRAFGLLLARWPELSGAVNLIACLVPSRSEVPEYREYAAQVDAAIAEVTSAFPGSIRVYWGYDRERALAAMRMYDVLFVNPVADGMNLVAQEGPVINQRRGVLVLSSGTGSARVLAPDSVIIDDPRDISATAEALHAALTMPARERGRRGGQLRARVAARDPVHWLGDQLRDLSELTGRPYAGEIPRW